MKIPLIKSWLAMGAAGLALILYNSAMVTARGFATKNRYEIDANREFIALGVANIGAGIFQGFAVSGADSRTAVTEMLGRSVVFVHHADGDFEDLGTSASRARRRVACAMAHREALPAGAPHLKPPPPAQRLPERLARPRRRSARARCGASRRGGDPSAGPCPQ